MKQVSWDQVIARRLARHHLLDSASATELVSVVHDTAGIHAQVMASAELQLAARVEGITQRDVRDALWRDRTLVKAWTLRGTLHLHPAGELALWFAACRAVAGTSPERLEEWRDPAGVLHPALEPDEMQAISSAVWEALDGRVLLREELAAEVVKRLGPKSQQRLLSGFAFHMGELCQGPPRGNKVTFARPDQWIEDWHEIEPEKALREVCRRFLRTYGPAEPKHFQQWFTSFRFKPADARDLFAALADELEEVDVEGRQSHVLAGDTSFPKPEPSVVLLPEYDVYVMGFRERDQLVPDTVRDQVAQHGRGRYEGPAGVRFLLIDGRTAGLWERKKRGKRIELHVTPSRKLSRQERAELDHQIERIGAFIGLEPVLTVE